MESLVNFYPIFEADQVLTADSLNDVVNYLEQQERLTRNKLIGIGIVCGLEPGNSKNPFSINISFGCGVTSAGYLIVQNNAVLRNYTDYNDPASYVHFSDSKGKQNIKLWELLEEDEQRESKTIKNLEPVTEDFRLEDMAVILYLESAIVDLKTCTENECDEKGKRRDFVVRRLLISQADLVKIINKCRKRFSQQTLTEVKLRDALLARFKLKELNIRRLSKTSSSIIEFDDLMNFYKSAVDGFTNKVAEALLDAYSVYKDVVTIHYKNVNPILNIKALLNSYEKDAFKNFYKLQYYYDFLKDLILAYNDFRKAAFDLMSECCPDENCFPFHLMINEAIVNPKNEPTIFRHYFIPSPILNNQNKLLEKVLTLFIRIVDMSHNFAIPNTRESKIKITPSNEDLTPLGDRAIPYYYLNSPYTINKNWNYDLKRKFKSEYNMSYNADKYNAPAPAEIINALEYNIDEYPFLRIEGHIGKSYRSVLQEIVSLKRTYNLPFEAVGLKLGRDFKNTNTSIRCLYRDLESMYNYLRSELICILIKEVRYFSSLNYRKDIFRTFIPLGNAFISTHNSGPGISENPVYKTFMNESIGGNPAKDTLGEIYHAYSNITKKINVGTFAYDYLKMNELLDVIGDRFDLITDFNYPLELIDEIEELVTELPVEVNDFNLTTFSSRYRSLQALVTSYRNEISKSFLKNKEELLDHLDKLYYDCSLTRFVSLFNDLKKRMEEIKKMNLFYYFLQKHPGMEHKAGVEKGGTFIIVYADADDIEDSPEISRPVFSFDRDELINKFVSIGLLSETAEGLADKMTIRDEVADSINSSIYYSSVVKDVPHLNLTNIRPAEVNIMANNVIKAIKDILNESNMIVVADFCLPYICCSECPPITYVTGTTTERVSVLIRPNEFCSDDKNSFDFDVTPPGGNVTGPGVSSNKFLPSAVILSATENFKEVQFIYTTTDNRTAATSARVHKMPDAKFEIVKKEFNPTTMIARVTFKNMSSDYSMTYLWDFGDGTTSADKDPKIHDYDIKKLGKNKFEIKLRVTNGVCSDEFTQKVEIQLENAAAISIKNLEFCVSDNKPAEVTVTPDDPNGKVTANGLTLNKTGSGKYAFLPAAFGSSIGNNSFINVKLEYKTSSGVIASKDVKVFNVPKPEFRIKNIQKGSTKSKVTFANSSQFAQKNEWHVTRQMVGGASQDLGILGTTIGNVDATIEFDTTQGIESYIVSLKVFNGACSAESQPLSIKITQLRG